MPKLAEIIGFSTKTISTLFSWIGIKEATTEEARESIGEITEYGSDRYFVKVNAVVQGQPVEKTITVDGPTLRNKKLFYDAVISKASVWIPEMKPTDFEEIMRRKYEAREKSKDYVEDAEEDLRFVKHFKSVVSVNELDNKIIAVENDLNFLLTGKSHRILNRDNIDKKVIIIEKQLNLLKPAK